MVLYILIVIGGCLKKLGILGEEYVLDLNGFFVLEEMLKCVVFVGVGYIAVELVGILYGLGVEIYWVFCYE